MMTEARHQGIGGPIGYVLKVFPRTSETFVINEMLAMESFGERVCVLPCHHPPGAVHHETLDLLRAPVAYAEDHAPEEIEVGRARKRLAKRFAIDEADEGRFSARASTCASRWVSRTMRVRTAVVHLARPLRVAIRARRGAGGSAAGLPVQRNGPCERHLPRRSGRRGSTLEDTQRRLRRDSHRLQSAVSAAAHGRDPGMRGQARACV